MAKYDKNISFTKMPNDYINEMLNNGETTKAMIFMLDLMTQKLRGKKFATRTIEKEIKESSISIATVSRYRKEFAQFMTVFDATQDSSVQKSVKQNSNKSVTPVKQKQSKVKPTTKVVIDNQKVSNVTNVKQECNSDETINKIKNKINILKEEEEEVFSSIGQIFFNNIILENFSIEFYDYIYPDKNTPMQQKLWFGNTVKDKLLDREIQTMQNVKNFIEFEEQQKFLQNKA